MSAFRKKVRYVGGTGINLFKPLSDGQNTFVKGVTYTVTSQKDFDRLLKADFIEVDLVVSPVEKPAEVVKVETQDVGRTLQKDNNTALNGDSK